MNFKNYSCTRSRYDVLIVGKGHEDYQILGTEKTYFGDHEQTREALKIRCH